MTISYSSEVTSFQTSSVEAHNVDCFLPIRFITESSESQESREQGSQPSAVSRAEDGVLSVLASLLLMLRAPLARVIRFFAVLGLSVLFLVLVANAALRGQITLGQTFLRAGATVFFALLGTRHCA